MSFHEYDERIPPGVNSIKDCWGNVEQLDIDQYYDDDYIVIVAWSEGSTPLDEYVREYGPCTWVIQEYQELGTVEL